MSLRLLPPQHRQPSRGQGGQSSLLGSPCRSVDSIRHFGFKYSDDGGRTWSPRRFYLPRRAFATDRNSPYGGKLKFFWTVGRAFVHYDAGYVPILNGTPMITS